MGNLNADLTPEEIAAPTYLEWSDATIARKVRQIAAQIGDAMGNKGIMHLAASSILDRITKEANAETMKVTLDNGTVVVVKITKNAKPEN